MGGVLSKSFILYVGTNSKRHIVLHAMNISEWAMCINDN